ncbi:AAA family ATPase [Candidatus Micrarchaeota archaeon]|nr:AAA family ATPase [Candidatus Micrarchaeota archaeon]
MVNFEHENELIAAWQTEQRWSVRDPFTHMNDPELFVGFDDLLKKLYMFAALGKNYAVVYGQYGYGKTALIKKIASDLRKKHNVVLFEDAPEKEYVAEKIRNLCSGKLMRALTLRKIDSHDYTSFNKLVKRHTILIFDEAHSIDEKVFSYARSLSENGTTFSVIFAGKPELVMGKRVLPQYLLDRLELSEGLQPLSENESVELIKKRVEGLTKSTNYLFTEDAMKKIARNSRFIPREILETCSKLVEYAIKNNAHEITEKDVERNAHYPVRPQIPVHITPALSIQETPVLDVPTAEIAMPEEIAESIPEEKVNTYERLMEGSAAVYKGGAHNITRDEFLRELSPLQKKILVYLFRNEPKSSKELSETIDGTYDTIRHMMKRLQGKYGEPDSKPKIIGLYPLIEERVNPDGRGFVYSLTIQTRKVMSTD